LRELRRIFGPNGEEVVGGWRRLRNEELHNLYASPHNIRVIKSRSMRLARHVAGTEEMRNMYIMSPRHGASSGCGWRRRPPDMEGGCEYIE
jgi:hypothetical protein